MNTKNIVIGVLAATTLLFGYLYFTSGSHIFGAPVPTGPQHQQMEAFIQGLTAGTRNQSFFANTGDLTAGGGTLNVTTSNTATSTLIAGCFQFYATSTATALMFQASTTPGVMYSQYGTCPNL